MSDAESNYQSALSQYKRFPMPIRTAEDDRAGAWRRPGDNAFLIRNLVFGGHDIFCNSPEILVAGGGTGDSTVFFARLLAKTGGGRVVHLDQRQAAIDHCRQRLAWMGLDNVEFLQMSLLDLKPEVHGQFDYINCNGVLHHLADAAA